MSKSQSWCISALVAALAVAGCVRPGQIDQTDVYRLQQSILQQHPQQRSPERLGPMRPVTEGIPELPVREDPDSGRALIDLSLQDAIVRALSNSSEIAVVSFDPAISRQQMIQAAAEFDVIMNGSFTYQVDTSAENWRRGDTAVFPERQTQKQWSVGVEQKLPTGTVWSITNTFVRNWDDATTDDLNRWYEQDLSLQVTQPLLRNAWPEVNLANLRIARLQHDISLSQFRAQAEETVRSVINTYYQLIQARREVDISRRLLKATVETFERVEKRQPIDATIVQIKQAEAAVQVRRAALIQAEKVRNDLQDQLVRLMNSEQLNMLDDYRIVPTTEMTSRPVKIDQADQLLTALRLNPQLEQARLAIRQSQINVKVAKRNKLPELNFSAAVGLNGASRKNRSVAWNDVVSGDFVDYTIALEFQYPIGNRQRKAALAEARLTRLQAVTNMQNIADQIAQSVRERIREVYTRRETVKIQRLALEAAKEQLNGLNDLEQIRGQLTPEFLNLKLNAQQAVAEAESAVLQALVAYNTAMVDLATVTGSVLELHQVSLAVPQVKELPASNPRTSYILHQTAKLDKN